MKLQNNIFKKYLLSKKVVLCLLFLIAIPIRTVYFSETGELPVVLTFTQGLDMYKLNERALCLAQHGFFNSQCECISPFYIFFLSLIYRLLGPHITTALMVQFFVGALTCYLVYLLGSRLFNQEVGLLAGIASALYGPAIVYEGILLRSFWVLSLNVFMIYSMIRAAENDTLVNWFVVGVTIAAALLGRKNILLFIPVFLIWLWTLQPSLAGWIKKTALVILGCVLFLSPFIVRNTMVTGKPYIFRSDVKTALSYAEKRVDKKAGQDKRDHEHLEPKPSNLLQQVTAAARLSLINSSSFWKDYEIPNNINYYLFREKSSLLKKLPLSFAFVSALGIVGLFLAFRERSRRKLLWLVYAFIAVYTVSITSYFILARYRLPIVPFLIIFGSYTVYWCVEKWRLKEYFAILGCLWLVVLLFFWSSTPGTAHPVRHVDWFNLGNGYSLAGDNAKALEAYTRAVETEPFFLRAYIQRARIAIQTGDYEAAEGDISTAFRINHHSKRAWNTLGSYLTETKKYKEAIDAFTRAIEYGTDKGGALLNIGNCYGFMNMHEAAIENYTAALVARPDLAEAYNNLGVAYIKTGRQHKAIAAWKRSLETSPRQDVIKRWIAIAEDELNQKNKP